MGYAFHECYKLMEPPVLPDGLFNLLSAFSNCIGMQSLPEIPRTVTNMNYTFTNCNSATKAPSEIPASVTGMESTFRLCAKLTGTIEINATTINNYNLVFDRAGRDSDGIVLAGSCPILAELAATKGTDGKVTVATA